MRRRRCSDSLLSASLLPVGWAARKNCESVLRDNFFLISCHILLRTKLLILQTPMGTTIILSTFLENAKLFLKRNSKDIFCFLSFIFWVTANYFLGDKNWIMVVKSLSKTISLSWRQIGNTFSQNTFYSSKTGVEVSSQRVTIQVEFSHVLRSISKGAFKIIYFPNYYGLKFDWDHLWRSLMIS